MVAVLQGVRILEVAEQTFVPSASAILADWGAEVIKVEHVERGDAMRGLASSGVISMGGDVHILFEHSNRGKKSIGLDLNSEEGRQLLLKLAEKSDVFLTNKLGRVRRKLKIDLEDIRAANPKIIYVRGSGQGEKGPDADKGAYDSLAFWARGGVAMGQADPADRVPSKPPAPGFGDSLGGSMIAGGICAALFHRERTGETTEVDVSLLSSGLWAMGQAIGLSLQTGQPWMAPPKGKRDRVNPIVQDYTTKDGSTLALCCLQPMKYWPELVDMVGRPELKDDPRFVENDILLANGSEAIAILQEIFGAEDLAYWRKVLEPFTGQWAVAQDTLQIREDPQVIANDYLLTSQTAAGHPFTIVGAPAQFGGEASPVGRAPDFNEHGDEILTEVLGMEYEDVIGLKVRGVVA
jgi:crotonobetainyl-CoA:carnitine CoA-transferase CaiB-like acyl-CoA transferase